MAYFIKPTNGRAKPVWADTIKPELPCIGCEVKLESEDEYDEEDEV